MQYKQIPLVIALAILLASIGLTAMQLHPIVTALTSTNQSTSAGSKIGKDETPPPQVNHKASKTKDIASYSLFGEFNKVIDEKPDIQQLPKTNLRLTLTGVSATENQNSATALIEGPDRTTESYKVGENLPGNASLHSVHKDRVILSRSGKLETLFFSESDSSTRLLSSVTPRDTDADPDTSTSPASQNPAYPIKIPEGVSNMSSEQKQSIRDKLSALRSRLRQQ